MFDINLITEISILLQYNNLDKIFLFIEKNNDVAFLICTN